MNFNVIGVDPGSYKMGICVIGLECQKNFNVSSCNENNLVTLKEAKTIILNKNFHLQHRLMHIYNELNVLCDVYNPKYIITESTFLGKSPKSAFIVGQVRGIALLISAIRNIELCEYSPAEIKMSLTGKGNAQKEQIQFMVEKMFDLKNNSLEQDSADAVAIALCFIFRNYKGIKINPYHSRKDV